MAYFLARRNISIMAGFEGTRLGAYELIHRTGSGGMAEVYCARQLTALNREVAVKVIRTGFAEDISFRERFLRAVQAITRLSPPHILPLIESGEEKGVLYLVMPIALRNEPLPSKEAIPLFAQLCKTVHYAHEGGIIHRDIKPQNVLLQSRTHVLPGDFGIARDLAKTNMTSTGAGVGIAEYMAPEQARGCTDMRGYIYGLGVVLFQLLTWRVPNRGNTPLQFFMQHTYEPLPDPRHIHTHLPADRVPVLQKALAKDPHRRFRSAQELARAIQEFGHNAITRLFSDRSTQGQHFDRSARRDQMETLPIFDTGVTQHMTTMSLAGQLPSSLAAP